MARPLVVPNAKVTMIFDDGVQGWTESHFYTSEVPVTDQNLYNDAKALCAARVAALDGRYAQLVGCRMSLDNVNRDSRQIKDTDLPVPTATGYADGPPPGGSGSKWAYTGAHQAWPVRLQTAKPTVNPIEYVTIGSIPAAQTGRASGDAGGQNVSVYINRYLDVLCGSKWGALYRNWDVVAPAVNTWTITNLTFVAAAGANPAQLKIVLANPPVPGLLPFGALIRMQGTTYNSPQKRIRLNGTYTVFGYNQSTGEVVVNVPRLIVDPGFKGYGTIQVATASIARYNSGVIGKLTHRKRGRPLDASRGRR